MIDAGTLVDIKIPIEFRHLIENEPEVWSVTDRKNMINTLQSTKRGLPQKLSFGSSAAYRSTTQYYEGERIPVYSHFLGGLSHLWGGSALVTPSEEFRDWPIQPNQISPYFQKTIEALPYAANSSKLDEHFGRPLVNSALKISVKDERYLRRLEKNLRGSVFVGQSRLLVHSSGERGCKYCGFCMTGCVYSSIFKSSELITQLVSEGKIILIENHVLHRISEKMGVVTLELQDKEKKGVILKEFDKVYLGAGATESTRIILNSVKTIDSAKLHGRGSCVIPMMSFTSKTTEWPSVNTLPSIFIEFLDKKLGAWTHVQMTNQNELVYKALGFLSQEAIPWWRRYLAANISTLMINDNSQYGIVYTFDKTNAVQESVEVNFSTKGSKVKFLFKAFKYSLKISFALKIVPLLIFTKMNNQTYHLGGSFPMTTNRTKCNETDIFGRLSEFENIHIVDSSTYPSIPSTTMAILLTANAWRITGETL